MNPLASDPNKMDVSMEDDRPDLDDLVDQLDRAIPREGATLRIPGDADGTTTVGTQQGYLRLGVEFLKAGLRPQALGDSHDIPHVPLEIGYLLTKDSSAPFDMCELVDQMPPAVRRSSEGLGAFGQLLAAVLAVIAIGLIVIGALAVFSRIFH